MNHADPSDALKRARTAIEEARQAAARPGATDLETCLSHLHLARRDLDALTSAPGVTRQSARDADRRALLEMRASLAALGTRLALAADFYSGWLRVRSTLSGGYAPGGDPAITPAPARLLAEG